MPRPLYARLVAALRELRRRAEARFLAGFMRGPDR